VAVGDSLVNAGRSWAFLLAESGGLRLTRHSVGGADSAKVLEQLPSLTDHRYEVGALSVGANDVLSGWSAPTFEANLFRIVAAMTGVCDRVLLQTIPAGLGRVFGAPDFRGKVIVANGIIADVAAVHQSCSVVDATDLAGSRLMSPDRVHPTDAGQAVLAGRAAEALGFALQPSPTASQSVGFSAVEYAFGAARSSAHTMAKRALGR